MNNTMTPAPDDDHSLLRRFVSAGDETASREIVSRHVDLVYSAAVRQVRAPHLAQDVAQSVFIELSRSAARIRGDLPLVAWLYTVTRRKAIDLIRRETTRHAREQHAASDAALIAASSLDARASDTDADWSSITDTLDEAMMSLGEKDRTAILLRFFANRPLREIGVQLNISEDAAQKRIARALGRLREDFSRRGFPLSGGTLAATLSAHAVTTAPTALAKSFATAALLATPAATTAFSALLAMTTVQKITLATLSLALGCALFEAHLLSKQRNELDTLRAELADARQQHAVAEKELAASDATLARADEVLHALANGPDAALNAELRAWIQRVHDLKAWTTRLPERIIPEMALLTESDWLEAARKADLNDEEGARKTMSHLRSLAKSKFMPLLQTGMQRYREAHGGSVPDDIAALTAYLPAPATSAMLARYEIVSSARISGRFPSELIIEKDRVDDDYDTHFNLQRNGGGWGNADYGKLDDLLRNLIRNARSEKADTLPTAGGILKNYPYTLSAASAPRIEARLIQLLAEPQE